MPDILRCAWWLEDSTTDQHLSHLYLLVILILYSFVLTRKHSSRMHTACLTTIYVWWLLLGVSTVCPQVNKFEQVSSDDPNVSSGGIPGPMPRGGGKGILGLMSGEEVYPAM